MAFLVRCSLKSGVSRQSKEEELLQSSAQTLCVGPNGAADHPAHTPNHGLPEPRSYTTSQPSTSPFFHGVTAGPKGPDRPPSSRACRFSPHKHGPQSACTISHACPSRHTHRVLTSPNSFRPRILLRGGTRGALGPGRGRCGGRGAGRREDGEGACRGSHGKRHRRKVQKRRVRVRLCAWIAHVEALRPSVSSY